MTVKEFLTLQECDYDIGDTKYDVTVTCCYVDEINDNYDKFCDLLTSKVTLIEGGDYPIADWSGFIEKNLDKFKQFAKENWYNSYENNDSKLIYEWVKEFHGYIAGLVSEKFYDKLVDFLEELE